MYIPLEHGHDLIDERLTSISSERSLMPCAHTYIHTHSLSFSWPYTCPRENSRKYYLLLRAKCKLQQEFLIQQLKKTPTFTIIFTKE